MTEAYNVEYSADAFGDLREIYTYIADELKVPGIAKTQVNRIRRELRALDFMLTRHALVEWEPWNSMEMRQLLVDNFIVYYLIDNEERTVTIVRIFYGRRDVEHIVNSSE